VPFPRSSFVMPVSGAFRSRREGKRQLCTFCGFQWPLEARSRLCQIAEDPAIGNVVAGAGLPALVLERRLDGKPNCPADTGLRDSRAAAATCCALTGSARSQ